MARYAKAIAAALGALGTWVSASLPDGVVSPEEWGALLIAAGGVFAVYQVKNQKA